MKNRQGYAVHAVIYCGVYPPFYVFQIESAAALDALQGCISRHSRMLQAAGCLRCVAAVEEKKEIVAKYLRWYIIERNSSLIDR